MQREMKYEFYETFCKKKSNSVIFDTLTIAFFPYFWRIFFFVLFFFIFSFHITFMAVMKINFVKIVKIFTIHFTVRRFILVETVFRKYNLSSVIYDARKHVAMYVIITYNFVAENVLQNTCSKLLHYVNITT